MSSVKTHPVSQSELLLYAEGELAGNTCSRIRSHILGCAGCQAELQNLQDGIKTMVQFYSDSAWPVPPLPWKPLDTQIEVWEKRWNAGFLSDGLRAILSPRYALAVMAALAVALVCFILQPWNQIVSANELLARATMAQSKNLSSAQGRVIHQRLQIHRKATEHGRQSEKTINYESWQDDSRKHFHESSASAEMNDELRRVYQANHLDWKSPLSAAAYEKWQSLLSAQYTSVARTGSADFTLTTLVSGQPEGDAIGKAQLVVSTTHWLPVALHLWLHDREYEISEVNSELLLPSEISPSFFDTPVAPRPQSSASRRTQRVSASTPTPQGLAVVPETATVEPGAPSTEPPTQVPAPAPASGNNDAAAPVPAQNMPDAPSPARTPMPAPTFSPPKTPAPVLTFTIAASGGDAVPGGSHRSSDLTLTYRPGGAARSVPGLEPEATTAPILVPNIIKPRPFKAFESSTVVFSPQTQAPTEPCSLKALGTKLGIIKQKKTEPAASAKPGG